LDKQFEKVDAKIIGANGNIFSLIAISQKALKQNGYYNEADELFKRVTNSKSYDDGLNIILEYVNPISINDNDNDNENGLEY